MYPCLANLPLGTIGQVLVFPAEILKEVCCWEVLHTDRAQPFSCSSISETPNACLVWACKITCFSAVVEFWTKPVPHSLTCCLFLQQSLTFLEAQKEHTKNAKLFALCPFSRPPKAAFAFLPIASAFWTQCSSGPAAGCLPPLPEQAVADPGRSPFSSQWRRQCLLTCSQHWWCCRPTWSPAISQQHRAGGKVSVCLPCCLPPPACGVRLAGLVGGPGNQACGDRGMLQF